MKSKLGDVAKIISGFAFKSKFFNDQQIGIPLIRIRDIKKGESGTYYSGKYDKEYLVNKNDSLIGMDGEFEIHRWTSQSALLNQRVCKLIIDDKLANPKYIYYILSQKLQEIEDKTPFVTVKHISTKQILSIQLRLPSLPVQQKIVSILENTDKLKKMRNEADELTTDFLQAVFLEMFGDPVKNTLNWNIVNLGSCGEVSSGFTLNQNRSSFKNNLTPYLRVANVFKNRLDLNEIKKIYVSKSEMGRYILNKGDVLIVEGHGNISEIGRTAVWNNEIKNCAHQNHIIKIRLNEKIINSHFLSYFLNFYGDNGYFTTKSSTTSGLNTISTNKVRDSKIQIPPIKLQEDFSKMVDEFDKIKTHQNNSKTQIKNLSNMLIQKAFKGELEN